MSAKIGCDIVDISRFRKVIAHGGEALSEVLFHQNERKNTTIKGLAGIFAAKEAVIKTCNLPPLSWLNIEITHDENGRPKCRQVSDLSISHDGNIAMAVALQSTV